MEQPISLANERSLKILEELVDDFEEDYFYGYLNYDIVFQIYKELIEAGLIFSEIKDKDFMADFFLIDLQYEFGLEEALTKLVEALAEEALADI